MKYQITKNVELPTVVKSVGPGFRLLRLKPLQQINKKQVIFTYDTSAFSALEYRK